MDAHEAIIQSILTPRCGGLGAETRDIHYPPKLTLIPMLYEQKNQQVEVKIKFMSISIFSIDL